MNKTIVDGLSPTDMDAFPSSWNDLINGGYIDACDNTTGLCADYRYLPWGDGANGQLITLTRRADSYGYPEVELSFSLTSESHIERQRVIRSHISSIPSYQEDGSTGQVTYRVQRPGSALTLENFVKTDGSTPMTDHWDFGTDYYIDNVADMSLAGVTDRTVVTGLLKAGSVAVSSSAGAQVQKPSCPTGYTPEITTHFIGLGGNSVYTEVGNIDTWPSDSGSNWNVHVRFAGLLNGETERKWHYKGNVGYLTWCEFA
ncbi:hypothetical protein [Photobacterium lutimaris]|nr:hypothetical protein [Photobacterium lutimaris]